MFHVFSLFTPAGVTISDNALQHYPRGVHYRGVPFPGSVPPPARSGCLWYPLTDPKSMPPTAGGMPHCVHAGGLSYLTWFMFHFLVAPP